MSTDNDGKNSHAIYQAINLGQGKILPSSPWHRSLNVFPSSCRFSIPSPSFILILKHFHSKQSKMRLTLFSLFSVAATVNALPQLAGGIGNGNGIDNQGNTDMRFKVPDDMTVKQAQAKCGNQAQLSCCNKAVYAGGGSGCSGIELFDQCSKLDIQIPILIAIPIQDLVDQNCKQNVACCQTSPSTAVSSLILILLCHFTNLSGLGFCWAWPTLHWTRLYCITYVFTLLQ